MKHRRWWLAAVVVVTAGAIVRWAAAPGQQTQPAPAVSTPAVPVQLAQPGSPPAAAAAAADVAAPTRTARDHHAAPPVWDVCGIGKVPRPPGTGASAAAAMELPSHLGAMPVAELAERTLATLRQGTPRQRAAALMLGEADADKADAVAAQLAELAVAAGDPVMLSWAWTRCRENRPCRAALAQAWVELEPANAASWLALLQSDPLREAEARARLATASHFSLRWGRVVHEAALATPADALPYVRLSFHAGLQAEPDIPSVTPLVGFCKPVPPPGSEGQARCSQLAAMLVEDSDTLLGYSLGTSLAQAAGWPASRLAALHAERKRIETVAGEAPLESEQALSCRSVERFARFIDERARLGELGYQKRKAALAQRR